jgi:ATP-dependent helicase/nuclease subunit A
MSSAQLTAEQHAAIVTRDVSIALSAGAGCGKTHVLTERFLAHLAPPADGEPRTGLGQLIAITFTDAAAREMRLRIRQACYARLSAAATSGEQEHWLRLVREIDSARVSTIHAFCASLLRAHADAADLDPTFAVLDQAQSDLLQFEVIDDVLREQLSELDNDTLNLAAACGLARLKQLIAALLPSRHDAAFVFWLDKSADDAIAAWYKYYADNAVPLAARAIGEEAPVDRFLAMLEDIDPRGKKPQFVEARAALLEFLPRLKTGKVTVDELQAIRGHARVQGVCSAKDWELADAYHCYKDACTELRKVIDRHAPRAFDPAAALETAQLGVALLQLSAKVVEEYQARKRAQVALDFDDLLAAAHALVSNPVNAKLRAQLADDLRLLLVDEFQDTDQLQVDLVKALCGSVFDGGRLFFVGDFKQSIYRFRGAEPKVFRELRAAIPASGRLPLTANFRSQPAILHFVNALFCNAFSQERQVYEPLRATRPQASKPPAIEFLWTLAEDKNNRSLPGAALDARRQEARAIACRIRSLIDEAGEERPVIDKDSREPRRLQLGDVAILFRALSDVQVYEEALREYGLDYYLVGGHAFYAQQEIYDVLNLLRAVSSAADEASLAGVLRSPIFALADETLFWLVESAGTLNAGLLAERLPPELSPEEQSKAAAAATTMRHLRSIKDRVPIAALLAEALDRTGYDAVLLAEFLGQRKLANLHKLIERARVADNGAIDIDGFITQLGQFIVRDPKEALAATLPEAADVIRLMTIHHAKGLEFPLVVVPDLDRRPLLTTPPAALHPELGPLLSAPADDEQSKCTTGMSMFAALERAEELEERKRMLYVAVTRAADYLILSSSLAGYDEPQSDWMKLLAERFDLADGHLVARLPDGYEAPQIRVTTEPNTNFKLTDKSRGPDLLKLLDDAHQLASEGGGVVPREVAPIRVDHAARRAFSFSRLTGQLVRPNTRRISEEASDRHEAAIDPRGFGTLVHEVLARVDFRDPSGVAEWCEHLAPLHVLLNVDEAARTACRLIERFIASPIGGQLAEAPAVHREVEFLLAWPPGHSNGKAAYIRGYIDCLYQGSAGSWHIADYKTDQVSLADMPRIAARYEMQLYAYAMAAERALGRPPADLTLHFLRLGKQHVLPWNDASRRRAIEVLDQSIRELQRSGLGSQS